MHCSGTNLKTSVARVPKQAPLQGGARRKVGLHQRLLMAEYMGGCRAVLYSQSSSPAACPLLLLSARVYRLCHILKKHIQVDFCFDLLFFFELYTSTIKMTRILTACKVVKTLKGRPEFCKVSAGHWSSWRSGTRLLSVKVTVTASRELPWSKRCFGVPRDSLL